MMACATHRLSGALRSGRIEAGAVFVFGVGAFLLLPALLLPGVARATFLILGWDLTLSSYSYCVHTARSPQRSSLGQCVFFLLVNPALVFSHRGKRFGEPRLDRDGGLRVVLGIAVMFASAALLRPSSMIAAAGTSGMGVSGTVGLVLVGLLRFLTEYASHSGLASIQLGLLRQTGYQAPERYRYPLLAVSPLDFWRRWNTYVGTWLRLYVFAPSARRLVRPVPQVQRRQLWRAMLLVPVLITMAASGALHDGYAYLDGFAIHLRFTKFFGAVFGAVVLWEIARWGRGFLALRHPWLRRGWASTMSSLLSRACLAAALIAAAAAWG